MKNFTTLILLAFATTVNAQPWLDKYGDQKPTLTEIENDYRAKLKPDRTTLQEEDETFEGKDYHFERWLFHWEGRTDQSGQLTNPSKHWQEYKKQQQSQRALAKGTSSNVSWTFHGPDNAFEANFGLGRINVIEFHPTDTNTYMIGSPGGGIWRTTDDGKTWTALNDFLPVLGVSDIDYNPQNPNTIYICTGDRDASDTYSMGVFKSTDGGNTWDTTGLQFGFTSAVQTTALLINPVDTNIITVAATGGIYKSYNAGVTWTNVNSGNFKQIVYHPTDTAIMYCAGSGGSQLYRSADGGHTWVGDNTVKGARRIEIAVTPANPAIVKVVAAKGDYGLQGIYGSNDTGKSFALLADDGGNCAKNILASSPKGDKCGGQGWYDLTIQISPMNPDNVIVGGVNTWYSTDGGYNWIIANQWSKAVPGVTRVHADKHCHKFHPLKPGTLYECNDGGIYKTTQPMGSSSLWDNLSDGLGITQFYRNAVAGVANFVLGGAQDNGTKMLVGGTSKQMTGADGMDCQIDPTNDKLIYTSQQYGELRRSIDGGDNFTDIQNNIPGKPDGGWITPLVINPTATNAIYAGYQEVFLSLDYGDSWSSISPDFNNDIDRIALSTSDPDLIYIMYSNTQQHGLRYTDDFGTKWNAIPVIGSIHASDIMVDPKNNDKLWVTYRTYSGQKVGLLDVPSRTYRSFNNNLPDLPVNCIEYDHLNETFYVGTDLGVYYREYEDSNWHYFNNNTLPNVEVIDLGINTTTNEIWAATYGRGMWSSPTHKSVVGIDNTIPFSDKAMSIYPNPNNGQFRLSTTSNVLKNSIANVRIVNMTGTTVLTKQVQINNSGAAIINADLPGGTYLVEVLKDNTPFAKSKLVVY